MCLEVCLDPYLSRKTNGVFIRGLDQVLEIETYANGSFLDLILSQEHILKGQFVNIATPL